MAITKINTPEIFDLGATNTSLKLPTGDTASRPTDPSTGEWRYNTTLKYVEYWDGGDWRQIQTEAGCTTDTVNYPTGTTVVAYYKLDYSGRDESSNNYDGTTTDITYVNGSPYSQAAVFNGSSSNIFNSNRTSTQTNTLTISAWVKSSDTTSTMQILQTESIWLRANQVWRIDNYNGTGAFTRYDYSQSNVATGNWVHVCVVRDDTSVTLYVNGSVVTTSTTTGSNSGVYDGISIGARNRSSDSNKASHFSGSIDQVRIYASALDSDQVEELYNEVQCPCTTNTVDEPTTNLAYYKLDGNANDSTANGYNGTWGGTEAYNVAPYGVAAVFNGSSRIETGITSFTNNLTISLWLKPLSLDSNGNWIFGNWNSTAQDFYFYVNSSGQAVINFDGQSGGELTVGSVGDFSASNWTHFAVSMSSGSYVAYINGNSVGTSSTTNTTFNNGQDFEIGNMPKSSSVSGWNGAIDQVRVFSTALSASQITQLYEEVYCNTISTLDVFGGSTGVALYQFENNANSTDSSTYNGTWTGTEAYVGGYFDKAASFNGSNNYITVPTLAGFTNYNFTMSFWFNSTSTAQQYFMDFRNPIYMEFGWDVGSGAYANTYSFIIYTGSIYAVHSSANLRDGNWHHIAVTYDGAILKMYIDNAAPITNTINDNTEFAGSGNVIGGAVGGTSIMDGSIDQVRIFNTELTEFQVTQLFSE